MGVGPLLALGEHHRVGDAQARHEGLGRGGDEALEGLLAPVDEALGRALLLDLALLLDVTAGLEQGLGVLDLVLRGLGDDAALGVEAGATRTACDLVELARAQAAHAMAVVLGEGREQHRVDGHVDAHAQRVGAADDGQKPLLRELLHEQAVAREHPRVVHAHAAAEQALERLAEGRGEARALAGLLHGVALLLGGHAVARERLRGVERRVLGEVHDVDGGVAVAQGQLDGGLERGVHVLVGEGHRALGLGDLVDRAVGLAPERRADGARVAQGGAHEQELRVGQGQERHLPGPAAVGLAKEVELVHRDGRDVARGPLAQGLVGEDLLCAADDGSVRVDVGVSGDHAHVVAAEDLHQVKELLGDEGLYGGGVVRAPVLADGHVGEAQRDHRLARARGRA